MMTLEQRLKICMTCSDRSIECNGDCICNISNNGIMQHCVIGICPADKYNKANLEETEIESKKQRDSIINEYRPLLYYEWPRIAKWISKAGKRSDIGLGDTVERIAGAVGGELYKKYYKKLMKEDCGCEGRKAILNTRFPYTVSKT